MRPFGSKRFVPSLGMSCSQSGKKGFPRWEHSFRYGLSLSHNKARLLHNKARLLLNKRGLLHDKKRFFQKWAISPINWPEAL